MSSSFIHQAFAYEQPRYDRSPSQSSIDQASPGIPLYPHTSYSYDFTQLHHPYFFAPPPYYPSTSTACAPPSLLFGHPSHPTQVSPAYNGYATPSSSASSLIELVQPELGEVPSPIHMEIKTEPVIPIPLEKHNEPEVPRKRSRSAQACEKCRIRKARVSYGDTQLTTVLWWRSV
jgi:hypothetical protein